jgi:glutamate synthase domain-containing protein 1
MCGIVGLYAKTPELERDIGRLLAGMAEVLAERGPDSAGFALYDREPGAHVSLLGGHPGTWPELPDVELTVDGDLIQARGSADPTALARTLRDATPGALLIGCGTAMSVYKGLGSPQRLADRFGVSKREFYQGIGHTRMATESAVTVAHCHPFATAPDLALVHNGSFSNHATVRRRLEDAGRLCDTDNDSEVAAVFIAYRLELGDDLAEAVRHVQKEFDGFFTLLVSTANQFVVVRDAYACKPAVIAETPEYVAVASEYRALAGLPGVSGARVSEPAPAEVHVWTR